MASTPIPPPFEHLTDRAFSFFPPIVGFEHNEWRMLQSTWSEILVSNTATGQDFWMARGFVGEISSVEDPVLIVGLTRELAFRNGMIGPHQRRVLSMPGGGRWTASGDEPASPGAAGRMETGDKRVLRLIGLAVGGFVLLCVLAVSATRWSDVRQRRTVFVTRDQTFLELTGRDDRFAIVNKLGKPASDRVREVGTIQFEALTYPNRKYTVLLMGRDSKELAYIGTVDDNWSPVHFVSLRSGGSTESLLRSVQRF